jgi:predicted MFS family arabinose efflux permease
VREGAEGARAHSVSSAKLADADAMAPKEPRGIARIFEPRALPGAVPMLFMSAAFGFAVSFAGLYGESLGIANAGVFYTCSAVSMIVIRFASKPLMEALLPIQTFALAGACGIVAFAMLLASGSNELLFYGAGLFYGVCLGISLPLNQSVAVKNTPPERWGATNALYLLASDIGIGGASVIWGATNDLFGFSFAICCVIGCVLVSYALAWAVYPQSAKRRSAARQP